MKNLLIAITFTLLVSSSLGADKWPIKHVVVLMEENRSFDHMLGFLKQLSPELEGLHGNETNAYNTSDPNSEHVTVNPFAAYVDPDPSHSVTGTAEQIFGNADWYTDPAPMSGFVQNLERNVPGSGQDAISMFNHTSVPIISTLAQEFAVFDHWFAAVPGPTEVNRMYMHSATSHGSSFNDKEKMILGYPQKSIYNSFNEAGRSWKIYAEEISSALVYLQLRTPKNLKNFRFMEEFFGDCKNGTLPEFSFLEPKYFPIGDIPANDQHPSHSVEEGEMLMKKVYEALRASPNWNETLFVITYDEHGGFYDHFPTPLNVPNPDGLNGTNPDFNFTRIGVRIPTIMVSPWINKNTIVKRPNGPTNTSEFEHSSMSATLKKMWDLPSFLTKRDEWAGTFEDVVMHRDTPRTDCPEKLPEIKGASFQQLYKEKSAPLTDLQVSWLTLAAGVNGINSPEEMVATQEEAGIMCKNFFKAYLNNIIEGETIEYA